MVVLRLESHFWFGRGTICLAKCFALFAALLLWRVRVRMWCEQLWSLNLRAWYKCSVVGYVIDSCIVSDGAKLESMVCGPLKYMGGAEGSCRGGIKWGDADGPGVGLLVTEVSGVLCGKCPDWVRVGGGGSHVEVCCFGVSGLVCSG